MKSKMSKGRLILAVFGGFLIAHLPGVACFAHTVGGLYDFGYPKDVYVSGSYAYAATPSGVINVKGGVYVIDISNPLSPTLKTKVETPGSPWGVDISGVYAYVADYDKGLQVIDIDPGSTDYLTVVADADTPGKAWDVEVSGGYAYVADYDKGLQVIGIDPDSEDYMTILATVDTPGKARDISVAGGYAYIADYDRGLQVVDISDPSSPTIAGEWDSTEESWGVYVSGDYAYIADGTYVLLRVIDISNPANPLLKVTVEHNDDHGFYVEGFALHGFDDYIYVASGSFLSVIDVSDPLNPVVKSGADTEGWIDGIYATENYVYVAAKGLEVFSTASGGICKPTSEPGNLLAFTGGNLEIFKGMTKTADLSVFDGEIYVDGEYLYAADGERGVAVVDVHDPANIVQVGGVDTPGYAHDIYVFGDYALVADGFAGLQLLDVSERHNPRILRTLEPGGNVKRIRVFGKRAYILNDGYMQIVDISTARQPRAVGR